MNDIIFCVAVKCQDDVKVPKFKTRGQTHRAVQGESVTLPCRADNLGKSFRAITCV